MAAETSKKRTKAAALPGTGRPKAKPPSEVSKKRTALPDRGKSKAKPSGEGSRKSPSKGVASPGRGKPKAEPSSDGSRKRTKHAALPDKGKPKAKSSGDGSKKRMKHAGLPDKRKPKARPSRGSSRESSSRSTAPGKRKTFAEDPGEPPSWEEIKAATGLTDEDIAELPELARRALSPMHIRPLFDPCAEAERLESLAREFEKALDAGEDDKVAEPTPAETPPPDSYCRSITHRGSRTLTKAQYASLLRRRSAYDMFINGMTREAICRKGKAKPRSEKLGPKQQAVLLAVIRAGRPIRPCDTDAWKKRPRMATANHLFERARAKADVDLGCRNYRAFRTHRNPSEPKSKTFEFAPPDGLRFCVIFPLDD